MVVPDELTRIPASDLGAVARQHTYSEWQGDWDREPPANKLKEIKPKLGSWASSCQRSRKDEVVLTRLRIGHCYGTHGFLLSGEGVAPRCSRCEGRRSVKHVLTECLGLAVERRRYFGGNHSLSDLIGESPSVTSDAVTRFLRDAGLPVIYSPV